MRKTLPKNLRGRVLFTPETTYEYFEHAFENGARIESVELGNEASFDSFMAENGTTVIPLFAVGSGSEMTVFTENALPEPTPGQRLIYLREKEQGSSELASDEPGDSPPHANHRQIPRPEPASDVEA